MADLSLDEIINRIVSNSIFLKLKEVVENIPNIHDHEDVYTHCLKTHTVARDFVANPPLTHPEAKKFFGEFISEEVEGVQRKDILIITALLHDCGKIVSFTENEAAVKINSQRPSAPTGNTYCPGHEYFGGDLVVPLILKGILPEKVIFYIQNLVRLHDTFNTYFPKNWRDEEILYDVKFRAEGYYIEALFNSYCDGFHSDVFVKNREQELKLLNEPRLYSKRKYKVEI